MTWKLNTGTTAINFANARFCVAASATAYPPTTPTIENKKTDTQVYLAHGTCFLGNPFMAVAFRGTTDAPGWVRDFDTTLVKFREGCGRVHRGFYEDVSSILEPLLTAIHSRDLPLFVTGHSKGAGEAVICAEILQRMNYNVRQVYTFGQPRVHDTAAARGYDSRLGFRTFRFVNGADLVARGPFSLPYRHAGMEVFMPVGDVFGVKQSADYVLKPFLAYKLACDGVELAREFMRENPLLSDHHIAKYVSAVNLLN